MSTLRPPPDPESDPRVRAVFDDIRRTRRTDLVNNLWRTLAFDPPLLERTWSEVKQLMASPTVLDPLTKEMVYIAVSVANACSYCVHSHTAAARARSCNTFAEVSPASIQGSGAQACHTASAQCRRGRTCASIAGSRGPPAGSSAAKPTSGSRGAPGGKPDAAIRRVGSRSSGEGSVVGRGLGRRAGP